MTELLTGPLRIALQNVADGTVYLWRRGISRTTWMLHVSWQPPSQLPYNWRYDHDYIELGRGWDARLTSTAVLHSTTRIMLEDDDND